MNYANERFEGVTVTLDGNSYTDCAFESVIFQYSGGPLDMANCKMDRFAFQFGGDLANGLNTLYQLFGTDGMLAILRGFTEPHFGDVTLKAPD